MARKITLNGQFHKPIEEVFDDFVVSQTAQGLSEITLATYHHHLRSISNHLDIQKPLEALTRKDLEGMVVSMRVAGLAHNSISSYCRVFRTFSNWCRDCGLNIPQLPNIKDKETVKEPKRILILSLSEYRILLYGLTDFRNQLIQQGRYTDAVDELLIKLQKAKRYRHG